jgi:hypothetical protein
VVAGTHLHIGCVRVFWKLQILAEEVVVQIQGMLPLRVSVAQTLGRPVLGSISHEGRSSLEANSSLLQKLDVQAEEDREANLEMYKLRIDQETPSVNDLAVEEPQVFAVRHLPIRTQCYVSRMVTIRRKFFTFLLIHRFRSLS